MSISKELLSEVLEEDIVELGSFNSPILEINVQRYSYKEWRKINIYELEHKCKEWALDNGYEFVEDINVNRHSIRIYNCGILVYEKFENYRLSPSDTFKACQWILAKQTEEDSKKQQQEDKEEYIKIIEEGVR